MGRAGVVGCDKHSGVPGLGPLQNNGGPTRTHAPLVDSLAISPAVDAGDPGIGFNPAHSDQRGDPFVRVYDGNVQTAPGARIDIGAVELQPQPADFDNDGDADADHDVDAQDLALWAYTFGAQGGLVSALPVAAPLSAASLAAADADLLPRLSETRGSSLGETRQQVGSSLGDARQRVGASLGEAWPRDLRLGATRSLDAPLTPQAVDAALAWQLMQDAPTARTLFRPRGVRAR